MEMDGGGGTSLTSLSIEGAIALLVGWLVGWLTSKNNGGVNHPYLVVSCQLLGRVLPLRVEFLAVPAPGFRCEVGGVGWQREALELFSIAQSTGIDASRHPAVCDRGSIERRRKRTASRKYLAPHVDRLPRPCGREERGERVGGRDRRLPR